MMYEDMGNNLLNGMRAEMSWPFFPSTRLY